MTVHAKILGARRSGTNAVEWILSRNYEDLCVWRHGLWHKHDDPRSAEFWTDIDPDLMEAYRSDDVRYVVVVKDPYAFYYSTCMQYRRENLVPFDSGLIDTWNRSNRAYLEWAEHVKNAAIVRHLDLVDDPSRTFQKLDELLSPCRRVGWDLPVHRLGRQGNLQSREFDRGFWQNRVYIDRLRRHRLLREIDKAVDTSLARELGVSMEYIR